MRFSDILRFDIVNRNSMYDAFYRTVNSTFLKYEETVTENHMEVEKYYAIEVSFTTFTSNESVSSEERFIVSHFKVTDVRVRCDIHCLEFNEETNTYSKDRYTRGALKTFKFSNDLLNYISKLQSYIYSKLINEIFGTQEIIIDFNNISNYVIVENSNNYTIDQIRTVINTIDDLEYINLTKAILNNKLLVNFKNELEEVLIGTENNIAEVFEKYKELLPILLLGYDATLEFEYQIVDLGNGETKPDIKLKDESNEVITLVELKRADKKLFGGQHRTDTLRVRSYFSNAIHQTNVQRNNLSRSSDEYSYNIPHSILIIGNLNIESDGDIDRLNEMKKNLNVLRYNNKDLTIMTYDQLIERIDLLISRNT